jgi:hypothetical protein
MAEPRDPRRGGRDTLLRRTDGDGLAEVGFPDGARVLFTVMSADQPLTAAEIGERPAPARPRLRRGPPDPVRHAGRESVPGPGETATAPDNLVRGHHHQDGLTRTSSIRHGSGVTALERHDSPSGERVAEMRTSSFVQEEIESLGERWRPPRRGRPTPPTDHPAPGHGRLGQRTELQRACSSSPPPGPGRPAVRPEQRGGPSTASVRARHCVPARAPRRTARRAGGS